MKTHHTNPYINQLKFGLLIAAIAGIIALFSMLASCGKPYTPAHEVVENEKYDVPAKSQISRKLVLKDSITRENVQKLLDKDFEWSAGMSMKHHDKPTHIFIYVYAPGADWKGADWLGMVSRVDGKDEGIKLAESLQSMRQ
jgi:hypothetical protein